MKPVPKTPMGGLDQHVGFQLRLAQMTAFKDLTAVLGPLGLKPTDFSVLMLVGATPGLKQQAVGEALRVLRPNLVSIVDQLEARDLLVRGAVEGDRRSHALSLTAEGERLLVRALEAHAVHDRRIAQALEGLDRDNLLECLKRIADMEPAAVESEGAPA